MDCQVALNRTQCASLIPGLKPTDHRRSMLHDAQMLPRNADRTGRRRHGAHYSSHEPSALPTPSRHLGCAAHDRRDPRAGIAGTRRRPSLPIDALRTMQRASCPVSSHKGQTPAAAPATRVAARSLPGSPSSYCPQCESCVAQAVVSPIGKPKSIGDSGDCLTSGPERCPEATNCAAVPSHEFPITG